MTFKEVSGGNSYEEEEVFKVEMIIVLFFAVLLLYPFKLVPKGYEFLLLSVPVIYFSQGDSQFYNRESPYFVVLVFGYLLMLRMSTRTSVEKK